MVAEYSVYQTGYLIVSRGTSRDKYILLKDYGIRIRSDLKSVFKEEKKYF